MCLGADVNTDSVTGRPTRCWVSSRHFLGDMCCPHPLSGSAESPPSLPFAGVCPCAQPLFPCSVLRQPTLLMSMPLSLLHQDGGPSGWAAARSLLFHCSPAWLPHWASWLLSFFPIWVSLALLSPFPFSVLGESVLFFMSNTFVYFKLAEFYTCYVQPDVLR